MLNTYKDTDQTQGINKFYVTSVIRDWYETLTGTLVIGIKRDDKEMNMNTVLVQKYQIFIFDNIQIQWMEWEN